MSQRRSPRGPHPLRTSSFDSDPLHHRPITERSPKLGDRRSPGGAPHSVKIPVGKGCGFVQFANRKNDEDALQKLQGAVIDKQTVRFSWGCNPMNNVYICMKFVEFI